MHPELGAKHVVLPLGRVQAGQAPAWHGVHPHPHRKRKRGCCRPLAGGIGARRRRLALRNLARCRWSVRAPSVVVVVVVATVAAAITTTTIATIAAAAVAAAAAAAATAAARDHDSLRPCHVRCRCSTAGATRRPSERACVQSNGRRQVRRASRRRDLARPPRRLLAERAPEPQRPARLGGAHGQRVRVPVYADGKEQLPAPAAQLLRSTCELVAVHGGGGVWHPGRWWCLDKS